MSDDNPDWQTKARDAWTSLRDHAQGAWSRAKPILHDAAQRARDHAQGADEDLSGTQKRRLAAGVGTLTVFGGGLAVFGSPSVGTLLYGTIMLVALAAGLFGIPAFVFLFSKSLPGSMRGVLARILWTIATLTQGGQILRHEENGEYQVYAPQRADDGTVYIKTDDGERVEISEPSGHWFRLGKKQFGITYEKTKAMYGDLLADFDEEYIAEDAPREDREAYADGGHIALLDMVRGGYQVFTPFADSDNPNEDGWILRADKAATRKRGAGGRGQAGKAKEQTLKEHGGNTAAIAGKWFYIAMMGALVFGTASGYLAGGM